MSSKWATCATCALASIYCISITMDYVIGCFKCCLILSFPPKQWIILLSMRSVCHTTFNPCRTCAAFCLTYPNQLNVSTIFFSHSVSNFLFRLVTTPTRNIKCWWIFNHKFFQKLCRCNFGLEWFMRFVFPSVTPPAKGSLTIRVFGAQYIKRFIFPLEPMFLKPIYIFSKLFAVEWIANSPNGTSNLHFPALTLDCNAVLIFKKGQMSFCGIHFNASIEPYISHFM
nr:MAG TPA: hypothetical protein [Caudoviricetes sp.]